MNIGFTMRAAFERATRDAAGSLSGLAAACLSNFEDLINALQTWGQVEHNEDGTHGDVTAETVTVSDVATLGRVRLGSLIVYTAPTVIPTSRMDNVTLAGIQTAGVLKIRNTVTGVTLTGIDAAGRVPGDLLVLINDDLAIADPTDFDIAAFDTNSDANNRFIGGSASRSAWTLHGGEAVWLMYDTYVSTDLTAPGTLFGWRVLGGVD
jgi:hypothetical protein